MSEASITFGEVYKGLPYLKCLLCNNAYATMTHLSINHVGTIYLCRCCKKNLLDALRDD